MKNEEADNEGKRVIVKFLKWYESLTPRERVLFELQLGKVIRTVKVNN